MMNNINDYVVSGRANEIFAEADRRNIELFSFNQDLKLRHGLILEKESYDLLISIIIPFLRKRIFVD